MNKHIEIIPAILPKDFAEVKDKIDLVIGFVKTVQIDVCDGQFVQNATWPYKKPDNSFERIKKEEEGMPHWQDLNFEIDLMANRPEERVKDWVMAGASRIVIHADAKGDVGGALLQLRELGGQVEAGLALNIDSPLDLLAEHADKISFVQCMGIDNVGFQGQHFDEKVLAKIAEIKSAYPDLTVSVDGGVSLETAPKLIEAGADRLVVGSAIFDSPNYIDAIEAFKRLAHRQ